jgi:DNA-binding helix-hairpin-helix protein with protein kinase domain
MSHAVVIEGKLRQLGTRIGKGGEGEIYTLLDDRSLAVKVYTVPDLGDRARKIRTLVEGKLAQQAPLVAFPLAEVKTRAGGFLGFAMQLVDGCKPLHELYAPGPRKLHFPHADYRFLVRTASNIARAVASVHRSGCVIGDINHSGILVSPKAVVALIDADSFQVTTKDGQFLCKVGVPEYTPPELQARSFHGLLRTPNHDAFGLAVVIFQLLFMGRHPFVGSVRNGDIPPLHESIQGYRYVYAENRDVGMDQPPGTPCVSDFYPPLRHAFEKAFSRESSNARPSASDWVGILETLEASLVQCHDNPLHHIPKWASECAWCEMERQLGTFLFLPHGPQAAFWAGPDPGADSFDLEGVWRRIQQARMATGIRLAPKFPSFRIHPSPAARKARGSDSRMSALWVALAVGSILGLLALPRAYPLWVILFFLGVSNAAARRRFDTAPFMASYISSEQVFARELANWKKRAGVGDFLKHYAELEAAHDDYQRLKKEEKLQSARYGQDRRKAQLHAFLDSFAIAQASIQGIDPAKRAVLASYGIDTAADVTWSKVLSLPGFWEASARPLLEWRLKLEKRFVYRPDVTAADDAAAAQVRRQCEIKAAPLRARLAAGAQNLTVLAARMRQTASREDLVVVRAKQNRDQATRDLEYLRIPLPELPAAQSSVSGATTSPGGPPASPVAALPSSSAAPLVVLGPAASAAALGACPRCGQKMVKRQARLGRNAGSYFWGCSRYPTCKGTRSI